MKLLEHKVMASVLITGASRGLGLAFVKELVTRPSSEVSKIIAATRREAPALNEIASSSSGRVSIVKLDVTDHDSINKAVTETKTILGSQGLDVLINNAGICQYASSGISTMYVFLFPLHEHDQKTNEDF